jgi:hypothetical protein
VPYIFEPAAPRSVGSVCGSFSFADGLVEIVQGVCPFKPAEIVKGQVGQPGYHLDVGVSCNSHSLFTLLNGTVKFVEITCPFKSETKAVAQDVQRVPCSYGYHPLRILLTLPD